MRFSKSVVLLAAASFCFAVEEARALSGGIRGRDDGGSHHQQQDGGLDDTDFVVDVFEDDNDDEGEFELEDGMFDVDDLYRFEFEGTVDGSTMGGGMYASNYWRRMLRALNENGTFHPPDKQDVADMLVKEINHESAVNGTANAQEAMAKIAEQLLQEAANKGAVDDSNIGAMIEDKFYMPENSPELDEVGLAAMKATNQSECLLPERCNSKTFADKVKKFIRAMINNYIKEGKEPDIIAIYEAVQKELGVEPKQADELIESSPEIRKYLKKKIKKAEVSARREQLKDMTDQLEQALAVGVSNNVSLDDTLDDLKMSNEEMSGLLEVMGPTRAKKALEGIGKPEKEMEAQIEQAYEKQANENPDNHTHFEETGEIDVETGHRVLRFVPHPSKMSMEDHIKVIEDRIHRRRLAREARPKHTREFQRRLADHIEELQGHIRELGLQCNKGDSEVKCVAEGMEDLSAELGKVGGRVSEQLAPLDTLLEQMDKGQDAMDKSEKIASIVYKAVGIATKIPGAVGTVFKLVKQGMGPITSILDSIDDRGTQFENSVGKAWDNSIGRVDQVIVSFDAGVVFYITQSAAAVAGIQESVCTSSLINELAGANVIGGIERAVDSFRKYIDALFDALKALKDTLESVAFKVISSTLNGIVKAVKPVQKFFEPFTSLSDLIQEKVTIKPWFKLPYTVKVLGSNRCDSGYHKGTLDKRTCYENDTSEWTYSLLLNKMRATCKQGRLSGHWSGECKNNGYSRHKCGLRVSCKFCCKCSTSCSDGGHSWAPWDPLRCVENCKSGYSAFLNDCYMSSCPSGFGNVPGKALCTRNNKRSRNSRDTNCNHHSKREGTIYKQDIFGQCWQSCGSGDKEFIGACFPPAVLQISIQDIFDALAKIMDFITGLPVVKEILGFIDKVVETILKPVMDKITEWLKKALNLPEFPSVNANLLPLDVFKNIQINTPEAPDLSQFMDLPSKALANVYNHLPEPLSSVRLCDGDMDCILKTVGMGDLTDMFAEIGDMAGVIGGAIEQFQDVVTSMKCKSWGTTTVKVSDMLAEIGLPDVDACDIELDYCEEIDTSEMGAAVAYLQEAAQPAIDFVKGKGGASGRRRLAASSLPDGYYPILTLDAGVGLVADGNSRSLGTQFSLATQYLAKSGSNNANDSQFKGKMDEFLSTPTKDGKKKQAMGLHIKVDTNIQVGMGILIRNSRISFGLEFGGGVTAKAAHLGGPMSLLKKSLDFLGHLEDYDLEAKDPDGRCQEAAFKARNSYCNEYEELKKIVDMALKPTQGFECTREKMEDLYFSLENTNKFGVGEDIKARGREKTKQVTKCIQHWFKQNNDKEKFQRRWKSKKLLSADDVTRTGYIFNKGMFGFHRFLKALQINTQWATMFAWGATGENILFKSSKNRLIYTGTGENAGDFRSMMAFTFGADIGGLGPNFIFGLDKADNYKFVWTNKWNVGSIKLNDLADKISYGGKSLKERCAEKSDDSFCRKVFDVDAKKSEGSDRADKQVEAAEADLKRTKINAEILSKEAAEKTSDAMSKQINLDKANAELRALDENYDDKTARLEMETMEKEDAEAQKKEERIQKEEAAKKQFIKDQEMLLEKAKKNEGKIDAYQAVADKRQAQEDLVEIERKKKLVADDAAAKARALNNEREAAQLRQRYENNKDELDRKRAEAEDKVNKATAAKEEADKREKDAKDKKNKAEEELEAKKKTKKLMDAEKSKGKWVQKHLWNAEKGVTAAIGIYGILDTYCLFTDCSTNAPTTAPTAPPTSPPTDVPTNKPTDAPTNKPTEAPTNKPTEAPTNKPTEAAVQP